MDKSLKQYHLVNNAIGWLIGIIACAVYIMTAEATASWWDCGEYIATAFKVQVGHPPGAPTFQIFGRLFSLFTDPYHAAFAVNVMSAVASGLGIMFLYWTITLLGKKLIKPEELALNNSKVWAVFGSGVVGALAYTFTDTYWFSAVEGEVYAMSSFFTAVVFWAILKWEEQADDKHSLRWLILISFLVGMAIGVHLLNLLTIPAIVYVVYFKKYPKTTLKGFAISGLISLVILAAVLWGVIPGIVNLSCDFDVFFVNKLHLGFNSGTVVFFLLIALFIVWGVWNNSHFTRPGKTVNIIVISVIFVLLFAAKVGAGTFSFGFFVVLVLLGVVSYFIVKGKNREVTNAALMSLLLLVVGYSTFFILVIRANTNTPLNENAPKDAVAMRAYLGREQYGSTPLLTGPYYTAGNPIDSKNDYAKYIRTTDAEGRDYYKVASYAQEFIFNENHTGFFPRMYSADNSGGRQHPLYYRYWAGDPPVGQKPTFAQNMTFFHRYQMGWMYWRYFMWNFAGRQNDIQGHHFDDNKGMQDVHYPTVNVTDGNWICGIDYVDEARLGSQKNLPDTLANNKARNKYYMLPLLLGMLGLIYHCIKNRKDAFVVFLMFFMTGLAIAIYLNMPPRQPRERDYAFVGSFYFFSVWIGLGVYALYDWLSTKFEKKERNGYLIAGALCVLLGFLFNGAAFILTLIGVVLLIVSVVRLPKAVAMPLAFVLSMSVPVILGAENWDDHDRSQKTAARDFAKNYLGLADKNSVVITFGDNDTFPLWYNQDTEGVRTDARVCNLSYLNTDWYIDQMIRPAYDSPSLPINWSRLEYCSGTNEYVKVDRHIRSAIELLRKQYPAEVKELFGEDPYELKNVLKYWVRDHRSDELKQRQKAAIELAYNQIEEIKNDYYYELESDLHVIPTDTVYLTIDKEAVRKSGMKIQGDSIPDRMVISLKGLGGLDKSKLMMLELLANANWTRPIYVAYTVGQENYMNLGDNFVQEGLANRITPFTTNIDDQPLPHMTNFDTEKTYDNVMNRYKFGGIDKPGIYLDETVMRMCYTHRRLMVKLATNLIDEGDNDKAAKVLEKCDKEIPSYNVPHDFQSGSIDMARCYAKLGNTKKAKEVLEALWKNSDQSMTFYNSLPPYLFPSCTSSSQFHMFYVMRHLIDIASSCDMNLAEQYDQKLGEHIDTYLSKGGPLPQ